MTRKSRAAKSRELMAPNMMESGGRSETPKGNLNGRASGRQTEAPQLLDQIPLTRHKKNKGAYGGPL